MSTWGTATRTLFRFEVERQCHAGSEPDFYYFEKTEVWLVLFGHEINFDIPNWREWRNKWQWNFLHDRWRGEDAWSYSGDIEGPYTLEYYRHCAKLKQERNR